MNRANWGKAWEVDHLFPLARVNLGRVAEFLAAVNWRNLQPLTPVQNKEKGDTITPEAQTLFNQLCQEFSHVY
jgi:5-methylcytosine-specific restriction endonuclease McrA